MTSYLSATRHPWPCLLFLFPLLLAYEVGVVMLAPTAEPNTLRNGADVWVRNALSAYGVKEFWMPPLFVLALLIAWTLFRWGSRPKEPLAAVFGMTIESAVYAGVLFLISRNFSYLLHESGIKLPEMQLKFESRAPGQLLTYIGAGIYEETLFRLGLFTLLIIFLRIALLPGFVAQFLAATLGALAFAAAHHIGSHGEKLDPIVFAFRTMAGLFFTALYVTRGYGIAVGAHAGYDVLVGVTVQ
jgi:hypothetical protein